MFPVTFTDIAAIPFPAVTVCAAIPKKWPAMVEALNYFDKEELIFDVAEKFFQSAIEKAFDLRVPS